MCCYSTVEYSVTLMCECYCNVFLKYITVQPYCYVCVTVKCSYSTVQYSTVLLLCVLLTVMCCYNTVEYSVALMCVCYCNVLLQYSTVQRYCYIYVLM